MFTKRRRSPVSSHSLSFRPGYCASSPSMQAISVPPSPETTSFSLVTLRSGVGILTVTLIVPHLASSSSAFNYVFIHRVYAHALLLHPAQPALDLVPLAVELQDHP